MAGWWCWVRKKGLFTWETWRLGMVLHVSSPMGARIELNSRIYVTHPYGESPAENCQFRVWLSFLALGALLLTWFGSQALSEDQAHGKKVEDVLLQ